MSFEESKRRLINRFKHDLEEDYNYDGERIINEYKEVIDEAFEKHRDCYNNRHNIFCDPLHQPFGMNYYDESTAMICDACDSIIFDSDSIKPKNLTTEEKRAYIKTHFDTFIDQYNECELDLFITQIRKLKGDE